MGGFDSEALRKEKAKGPPCSTCYPGVLEDNESAFEIARRVVTSEGVRFEALEAAMRIYRIKADDRPEIADKVLLIASQFLKGRKEENA